MGLTLWTPDTCSCGIVFDTVTQIYAFSLAACPHHAQFAGSPAHLMQAVAENRKKCNIINAIVAATPAVATTFSVDPVTGAMTIRAAAIPANTLAALQASNPGVTIVVDPTVTG